MNTSATISRRRRSATPGRISPHPTRHGGPRRPVLHGRLGRLMVGVTAFELGNAAATLLILRATDLFEPGHSETAATQLALVLYVLYNLAATVISVPAGWHGDRYNPIRVLTAGAVCFTAGYLVFAAGPRQPYILAAGSILAGLGIGCGETAESAAVTGVALPTTLQLTWRPGSTRQAKASGDGRKARCQAPDAVG